MIPADALVELLVLEIEKNGSFFDFALLKNVFDDVLAAKAFWASLFKNTSDDVCDGSLFEAPAIECVDATAN